MDKKTDKAATGVDGLDDILAGGLRRGRVYLLEGSPGTGKTTIATQFLLAGRQPASAGSTSPCRKPRRSCATAPRRTAGRSTTPIEMFELVPPESLLDDDQQQSLLYSSDLELGETTKRIFEAIERSQAAADRARQPVRDPPARAKLAALPAPGPGAEALFRAHTAPPC